MSNYDGLTRNEWSGTWSPAGDFPIVLDTEIRGGLRLVTGEPGDTRLDIPGQRLQEGMLVFDKSTNIYYKYISLPGETRNSSTGDLPNNDDNWELFASGTPGADPRVDKLIIDVSALDLEVDFLRQRVDSLESTIDDITAELFAIYGNERTDKIFLNYHLTDNPNKVVFNKEDYKIDKIFSYYVADENEASIEVDLRIEDNKVVILSTQSLFGCNLFVTHIDKREKINPLDTSGPFELIVNGNQHINTAGNRITVDYSLFDILEVQAVYLTKYNIDKQINEIVPAVEQFDYNNGTVSFASNQYLYGCDVHLVVTFNPSLVNDQQHIGWDFIEFDSISGNYQAFDLVALGINTIKSIRIEDASSTFVSVESHITDTQLIIDSNVDLSGHSIKIWYV